MSRIKQKKQGVINSLVWTNQNNSIAKLSYDGSTFAFTAPVKLDSVMALPNGTAAAPSLYFTNSTGVGIYRSASNVLGIATAGVERITVDAQGDINIMDGRGIDSEVANGRVPFIITAATNDIAAAAGGAISVANYCTTISTDAGGDAFTLAAGTIIGQLKKIIFKVDGGGDAVVTGAFAGAATTLTFSDAGEYALLMWDGTDWIALELCSLLNMAHAPVIS